MASSAVQGKTERQIKHRPLARARAELDLQNDISRLLPAPGQRVFTTIRPKEDNNDTNSGDTNSGTQPAPVN